jgi:Concanavalin A-like lectin/glucanases superfamily
MKSTAKKNSIRLPIFQLLIFAAWFCLASSVRAGLTFELDVYVQNQGQSYVFYTPLFTNSMLPDAPLGSYFISSPHWPTNGSTRAFDLTASGLSDHVPNVDSEFDYDDFSSAMYQITNGTWTILFTNTTTTNLYTFTVSASNVASNTLPATIATFPMDGAVILTGQTTFTWQGPTNWAVNGVAEIFGDDYFNTNPPAAQSNWTIPGLLPVDVDYTFYLHYVTNYANPIFVATTPLSTNTLQPISGWASSNVFETGSSVNFAVVNTHGTPSEGHTCLAYYSFEDNNLFAQDFSGNNNGINSYAWFSVPPYIVTNDAEAGMYAGGFGGSGWFVPPTNLLTTLAGSFSVSLWLKTSDVHGHDSDNEYSAAGIVSALAGDYGSAVMPMGLTGSKLAFYTGGTSQNILHSQANINTGQYVHVVTTRDEQTGEKRIYINGVLDSSVFSSSGPLTGAGDGGLNIGYNNGQVFTGEMDEIQFYSGVLSSNEVTFLHSHPGTNVADTLELGVPVARFDFEDTNSPGIDSSGHNNNANCSSGSGDQEDMASTNAAVGSYARQYFGDTSICFTPDSSAFNNISNAIYGSFSLTAWVKTTNSVNEDFANAYFGAPILFDYSDGTNQVVFSITGSKAAFTTGNPNGGSDTILHSTTSVNDGNYHFLAATRNQTSGLMNLYVDGNLEATGTSTNGPRIMSATLNMAGGYYVNYAGLLDDVRIYSGELTADDVAILAGIIDGPLGTALNAPDLPWATSGDSNWFVETTNTYDGVSAAQSGVLTDDSQYSSLQTTVTGPGILTFWWSSSANDGDFDLEFDIDGGYGIYNDYDDLYGNTGWTPDTFTIPDGVHTLTWFAYNADCTNDAGWVDQVVFTPASAVTIMNPQSSDENFQFSFASQSGFTYTIEYCTDLSSDDWQSYSTITGDGTVQNIQIPICVFNGSQQGFVRVITSVFQPD